ncbi:MAG: hypothetical protein AB7H77_12105 [Bdellovibrionales bacterium]
MSENKPSALFKLSERLSAGQWNFFAAVKNYLNEFAGEIGKSGKRESGFGHALVVASWASQHEKAEGQRQLEQEKIKRLRNFIAAVGREMMEETTKSLKGKETFSYVIAKALRDEFALVQRQLIASVEKNPKFDPLKVKTLIEESIFIGSGGRFTSSASLTDEQYRFYQAVKEYIDARLALPGQKHSALKKKASTAGRDLADEDYEKVRSHLLVVYRLDNTGRLPHIRDLIDERFYYSSHKRLGKKEAPYISWTGAERRRKMRRLAAMEIYDWGVKPGRGTIPPPHPKLHKPKLK